MAWIPDSVDAIDAEWLTEALGARHPGATVASVELAEQAEVTSAHGWLRVGYTADSAPGPERLFAKLLPTEAGHRAAIAQTRMGLREARFYETLAESLPLRVPQAHVVRYEDDAVGAFAILLEDLAESGCTVSSGPESPSRDAAAVALEELAAMHVRFEEPSRRSREAAWVAPPEPASDYGVLRLQEGLAQHRDRLTAAFAEMAEVYVSERDALHRIWDRGRPTVIHGDAHIGNLFDDAGRVGFLDWGLITLGPALRDVSYFLCMALSVEDRRAHERDLLRHYLSARLAQGGEGVDFDDAWRDHRLFAAYLAPACCQVVTFPEDVTPRRRRFADAFLARASAAIEDLESRDALRRFEAL